MLLFLNPFHRMIMQKKKLPCLYVLLLTMLSHGCHLGSHEMAMHETTTRHAENNQNQETALSKAEQIRLQELYTIGNTLKKAYQIEKKITEDDFTKSTTLLHWLLYLNCKSIVIRNFSLVETNLNWTSEDYARDIALMIKSGIDINQRNKCGWSALSLALVSGEKNFSIIDALLATPTIDIPESDSESVIRYAIYMCSPHSYQAKGLAILKTILSKPGIDLNQRSNGRTFLDFCNLIPSVSLEVKNLLRAHGARTKQELVPYKAMEESYGRYR